MKVTGELIKLGLLAVAMTGLGLGAWASGYEKGRKDGFREGSDYLAFLRRR